MAEAMGSSSSSAVFTSSGDLGYVIRLILTCFCCNVALTVKVAVSYQ